MRWQLFLKDSHFLILLIFHFFHCQLHFKYLLSPLKANRLAALLYKAGRKVRAAKSVLPCVKQGCNIAMCCNRKCRRKVNYLRKICSAEEKVKKWGKSPRHLSAMVIDGKPQKLQNHIYHWLRAARSALRCKTYNNEG